MWEAKKKENCHSFLSKIHHVSQAQHNTFEELEKYLVQWLHGYNPRRSPWRTVLLQQRSWTSLKICGRRKRERIWWRHILHWKMSSLKLSFKSCEGWLKKFKSHVNLQYVNNLIKQFQLIVKLLSSQRIGDLMQKWFNYTANLQS